MATADRCITLVASALVASVLLVHAPGPPFGTSELLAQSPGFGLGHSPNEDELRSVDIEVTPDGHGLPRGSGTAEAARAIYSSRCAQCHGATGKEGPQDVLAGGRGTLATDRPLKTVGSYWPYATTLWDYVNRAMPFDRPGTLTPDQVYALTAYILNLNAIVGDNEVLDERTLPQVKMPNRDGFVPDPRPDTGIGSRSDSSAAPSRTPKKK